MKKLVPDIPKEGPPSGDRPPKVKQDNENKKAVQRKKNAGAARRKGRV